MAFSVEIIDIFYIKLIILLRKSQDIEFIKLNSDKAS